MMSWDFSSGINCLFFCFGKRHFRIYTDCLKLIHTPEDYRLVISVFDDCVFTKLSKFLHGKETLMGGVLIEVICLVVPLIIMTNRFR